VLYPINLSKFHQLYDRWYEPDDLFRELLPWRVSECLWFKLLISGVYAECLYRTVLRQRVRRNG